MPDPECVAFLRWCLPRLRLRWEGYRRVRRQVCKRVSRRLRALGLEDVHAYRRHLESQPGEWQVLDGLCRITISRFHRDRRIFARLTAEVLPELAARAAARRQPRLRCWSAGCASGEEAYTVIALWKLGPGADFPGLELSILATDADPNMIRRARQARYAAGSLRDVPGAWLKAAFEETDGAFRVRPAFLRGVEFRRQDIRQTMPPGPFDLVLCRNLAFTYFEAELGEEILRRLAERTQAGGVLVIGGHEALPENQAFAPMPGGPGLYRRCPAAALSLAQRS